MAFGNVTENHDEGNSQAGREQAFGIGQRVKILVGECAGECGVVYNYHASRPAPWHVRPDGWDKDVPGIAFCGEELEAEEGTSTVVHKGHWNELWQAWRDGLPKDPPQERLPLLNHDACPMGHLMHLGTVCGREKFAVYRLDNMQPLPPALLSMRFWCARGDWQVKHVSSYEEIPAAFSELGLPVDGWSVDDGEVQG